jgi:hypothetical protein
LVDDPAAWTWSSYAGYAGRQRPYAWVAQEELLASWGGAFGGPDPAAVYGRFVDAGLAERGPAPWTGARHGWIIGGAAFAERLRREVGTHPPREGRREVRQALQIDLGRVVRVVGESYGVDAS